MMSKRKDATLSELLAIYQSFPGSQAWAARLLNVCRATVNIYLHGRIVSARMDEHIPRLAMELRATNGECMRTVRREIPRLRRRR